MHTWPGASWYCYCNTSVEKIFMLVFWQIQISISTWYWHHSTQQNRRTRVEVSQSSSDEQARSQLWQKGPIPNFCVKATFESATKLFWAARQQRTCFGLKGHFHPYISNISKWFCFKLESKICKLLFHITLLDIKMIVSPEVCEIKSDQIYLEAARPETL